MSGSDAPPRLLLVGGGGGLVGRALVREFGADWKIRSVHRHASANERIPSVEWIAADAASIDDWRPYLTDVDLVVNVAWYRAGPDRRFRALASGLSRLFGQASASGVRRVIHLSVPRATEGIETHLPYMVRKREVDRAVVASGVPYSLVRPTMLFGPRDKLLTVMMRTIERWHRFPMFGDGAYHVSPLAVSDLARIVRREAERTGSIEVEAGGPRRWRYRELTDLLFTALGRSPRYLRMSPQGGRRLALLLETFGSSLLYAYEVEWLVSDRLGLAPYAGLDRPLLGVEPFVREEAARLRPVAGNP
jgi:uncharacterized protein YbjT (DUF2867 family)